MTQRSICLPRLCGLAPLTIPRYLAAFRGAEMGLGRPYESIFWQLWQRRGLSLIPPFAARLQRDAEVSAGWEPLPYNGQAHGGP